MKLERTRWTLMVFYGILLIGIVIMVGPACWTGEGRFPTPLMNRCDETRQNGRALGRARSSHRIQSSLLHHTHRHHSPSTIRHGAQPSTFLLQWRQWA